MNRSKRVVHMTTVHHPLDTRIYYKECQSLQAAGYDVTLIAPNIEDEEQALKLKQSSMRVITFKKPRNRLFRMLFSTLRVYKTARQLQADYYHFHDPELLLVAALLKRKHNVVIFDVHEDYETSIMLKDYLSKPLRRVFASIYSLIEKILTKNMHLCLAEKYYKNKYPQGTCILNYPLLDSLSNRHQDEVQQNKAKAKASSRLNGGAKNSTAPNLGTNAPGCHNGMRNKLIYTGNVSLERGAGIHAGLPLIDSQLEVYFIGKCPQKLASQMYEVAGDQRERIIIEGIDRYIPREEIDAWYHRHDWLAGLALFPPLKHYMQKELTKFFEYMAAGIPIICSNFPVWKQFIEEYACGLTVNPYDTLEIKEAVEYLKANPNKAREMGENGRRAVLQRLNWETEEKKLVRWYAEIGANPV